MRHMVSRLDANASAEYQRPKSLEEAPASRDMDSFLKENKMEGLLARDSSDSRSPQASRAAVAESVTVPEKETAEPSQASTATAEPTEIAKVVSNEQAEQAQEESRADKS